MTFELKPFQRVKFRNGREGIITDKPAGTTPEGTTYPLVCVLFTYDGEYTNGYMPGQMTYARVEWPEWDVVKVWAYPEFAADLLDCNRKGNLLWTEESKVMGEARADVESAKALLASAEDRLARALEADK